MESSGRAVFKTVPGFAFRATFEVDIEGFTVVKVMMATTVFVELQIFYCIISCRYVVQASITKEVILKLGNSVIVGSNEIPFDKKVHIEEDFTLIW